MSRPPARNPGPRAIIYECGICGSLHPWSFNGDCRDDENRYANLEDFMIRKHIDDETEIEVRSMDERVAADFGVTVDELDEQGWPRT